jgi:hypothetical protein
MSTDPIQSYKIQVSYRKKTTDLAREHAMSKLVDVFETNVEELPLEDTNPTTKLERRRRIEELHEEKRLREELGDYELHL